jgi:hypothetical protein
MLMFLWQYRGTIQLLVMIALTILAWKRGADPERDTALVLLAIALLGWVYRHLGLPEMQGQIIGGYFNTDLFYVLVDTAAFAILFAIALFANRIYPLWIAGFQLTSAAMHLVNEIVEQQAPFAYALLNILPSYFMMLSMTLGLVLHVRREKRWGPYPSWRNIFGLLPERGRGWQQNVSLHASGRQDDC